MQAYFLRENSILYNICNFSGAFYKKKENLPLNVKLNYKTLLHRP